MKDRKIILIIALIICTLAGCGKKSYFSSDIPEADIPVCRFDSALLSLPLDTAGMREGVARLWAEYPEKMDYFVEDIMGVYLSDTDAVVDNLINFLTDTVYGFKGTNEREKEIFADIRGIRHQINVAFGRIHYLYPDWEMPEITLLVSGFHAGLSMWENHIYVGADMYLGSDYELYNKVVYNYQKQTMRKECIPTDCVTAYLFRNLPYTSDKNRLLDNMLYRGKIMYLSHLLMPDEEAWETMGYTKEQWDWCVRNEKNIWRLMMDKQDLYKSEHTLMTDYLNDGPFTSAISQDSPARLGTWIGWRITEAYIKANPEVSIQQLMAEGNAQKILEESRYRP